MRAMVLTVVALVGTAMSGSAQPRDEVSLNGAWEYVKVEELELPPPAEGWQEVEVPWQLSGYNYERAWFRRSFDCDSLDGRRAKIHFGGVKWHSQVYVNGKHVGGNLGGYEPFDVDITDAVKTGGNQLLVGVHDWTGVFVDRSTEFGNLKGHSPRYIPRDQAISPIGGLVTAYGIWDDVKLVLHAPVYVSDIFIKTSVKKEELRVDLTITNESGDNVTAGVSTTIEPSDREFSLTGHLAEGIEITSGGNETVTLTSHWDDARLWSHLDPYLYHLRTMIHTDGAEQDVLRTRFGFREFEVRGPDFYLNGKKINLLATSWWPSWQPMTPEQIREQMRIIKYANCVAFRTHTQPWRERWYEIADEVGLLMIPEGAVWNDDALYRLDDERWWGNYALHLERMVDRDKNKPSVIMWSLENEFYGGRMVDNTPYEEKLAEMGRIVKRADPTRPIFYESDGDPGGVADVIGIHYPHEYPGYTLWPNEADWLENPIKMGHAFTGGSGEFHWKKEKPLYIGEFLWIPSADPSWDTVWFGDEGYRDYGKYHVLAKAESWRQQVIGYRRHGVAGISPWTMIEGGPLNEDNPLVQAHRYAYQPIAAFPGEYDSRFFGGEPVDRTLDVFNDSFEDRRLTLRWTWELGEKRGKWRETTLEMPAGDYSKRIIALEWPKVKDRTEGAYVVAIVADGETVFQDAHPVSVFPRPKPIEANAATGLHDPEGTTASLFERTASIEDLSSIPGDLQVLVIGADALGGEEAARPVIGGAAGGGEELADWVAAGGRAVVLEQSAWPVGLIPVQLSKHASTMTFPQVEDHPLLRDIRPEDLKYWRGDHTVTDAEPVRPLKGACVPVVGSGSTAGIAHAPLMIAPHGDGAYIFCQMLVASKAKLEPIAAVLLRNLLDYAAEYPVNRRKTALYCDLPQTRRKLEELRLEADDVTGDLGELDLDEYNLLISASRSADPVAGSPDRMIPWVEAGGNVLIHGLAPDEYAKLADVLDPALRLMPYRGHALRAVGDDPLLFSFTNEDLYWLGEHRGVSWSATPLAQTTATAAFEKVLRPDEARRIPATDLELAGKYVGQLEDEEGVYLATVGTGTVSVDFPEDGEYTLGLVARGTPTDGVYPLAEVRVDGEYLGTVSIRSNEWDTYTTFGDVTAGRHELRVAFINDGSNPPLEDRNLYIRRILIAPAETGGQSVLLTRPGALARFPRGKGAFIVDNIAWDTEERNSVKASRFISGLLTGLGARFSPEIGVPVEAESMEPESGMPHFSKVGGQARIATNGYIDTEVEVARAGRYRMEIIAGGTPAEGEYAIVEVSLGERTVGSVQLTSGSMRSYSLEGDLAEGVQMLRLAFTNDMYAPPDGDRNLFLDRIVFYGPE